MKFDFHSVENIIYYSNNVFETFFSQGRLKLASCSKI